MNRPVIIFTNLFTLENKLVENNKYIDIYYIWLNNIIQYSKLKDNDYCITFIDEKTLEYISKNILFINLMSKIKNRDFIVYKQPKVIKEGMMKRYDIEEVLSITKNIEKLNPQYMYLDIDVLVVNDIRKLFVEKDDNHKTLISLTADNRWELLNGMFYGELASNDDTKIIKSKNVNIPGFSSGIFGWCNSIRIREYFDYIKKKGASTDKELYTVDQPFFNAAVFNYFFQDVGKFKFNILDRNKLRMNTLIDKSVIFDNSNEVVLIDYCGEPGDDKLHWNKIFSQLIIQNL